MATESDVISGVSVVLSIVETLVVSVRKVGGTDEDIRRLTTPDANGVWDKIAEVIVEAGRQFAEVFTVVVDYGRSVKDSVAAGNYEYANGDITDNNFPPSKDEMGEKVVQFSLYYVGKKMEPDWFIVQMDEDGKRPATLRELLAFGKDNSELQRRFPIIALGSVWADRFGRYNVACLKGYSAGRSLHLYWCSDRWEDYCRFLAVSK